MEAIAVQDNGTEASHGTTMEDISMDERAAVVEGTETRQGELAIEDGSVGNGISTRMEHKHVELREALLERRHWFKRKLGREGA